MQSLISAGASQPAKHGTTTLITSEMPTFSYLSRLDRRCSIDDNISRHFSRVIAYGRGRALRLQGARPTAEWVSRRQDDYRALISPAF